MNRPKIKVALTGILLLFGAIFVLFSCFAVLSMRTLNNNFAQIAVNSLPEISTSKELKNNLLKLTMDYLNQIMALDRASRKAMEGVIVSDTQLFLTTLGRALESSDPVEQSWISKIKTTFSEMQAKAEPMFEMSRRGFQSEANRIAQSEIQPLADEIGGMLDSIGAQKIEKADAEHQHSEDVFKQTMKIALVSIAAAVVILIAGIFFAIVGIARPIERITRSMNGLVGGNIAAEIPFAGRCDEIGAMAKSVSVFRDHAIERLRLEKEASDSQDLVEREREQRLSDERQHAAHIQKAVQSLASALDKLAAGNLAHRIEEHFVGDLDCLRDNFNSSVDRLNNVLAEVGHNAHAIDAGATEIRTAAHSLAARTEQQASSLEETASSLREITQAVHESANWAVEAGSLIDKAREEAENSGGIITRAIGAMQEINRSADEISSIVGIIDSMAFQTNLLALNAGVEAARAGESGKGFAVVAQEVRELAQRSAHAARAIKTLIGSSDSQVKAGVALVNQTGEALQRILGEVKSINGQIQLMVSRTQDQAKRIETVSSAVSGLDRSTQQNAAMVEEQNGACRGLAGEASALNRLLQQFHLGTMGNEERRYRATA